MTRSAVSPNLDEQATHPWPEAALIPAVLYALVVAIFLTRSSLDPILDASKFAGAKSLGLGAIINVTIIGVCALLVAANCKVVTFRDTLPWASFLLLCMAGSVTTHDPVGVARFALALVSTFCAFVIPLCLVRSARDVGRLTDLIVLSALAPAVYGFIEIARNLGDPEFRSQSTFSHPNIFAFYIVVVMGTILVKWSSRQLPPTPWRRIAYLAAFAVLGVLLVYTKTRSAWFGAAAMLAIFAIFVDRRALPILVMVPALAILQPGIRERLMDAGSATDYVGTGVLMNSYEWRKALWSSAFTWIEDSPFLGHGGLDSFYYYSPKFFPYVATYVDGVYAHSVFVQLLFEIGIFGFMAYLAIIGHCLLRMIALAAYDRNAAIVGGSLCIAYLGLCYSDNMLYYLPANWYLFLLLGSFVAWSRIAPRRQKTSMAGKSLQSSVWGKSEARISPFDWPGGTRMTPRTAEDFTRRAD